MEAMDMTAVSDLWDAIMAGKTAVASAAALWLLVRILKDPRVNAIRWLDAKWRSLLVIVLGVAAGAADSIVRGVPVGKAVTMGLVSAALAIAGQEVIVGGLMGGKEPLAPKPTPEEK